MTIIRDLIDICKPGITQSVVLNPCSCFSYYIIQGLERRLSCQTGLLFDHTLNKCRREEDVKRLDICNPRDPAQRCDTSSKHFLRLKQFCEVHNVTGDYPADEDYVAVHTFTSVSQGMKINTLGTATFDAQPIQADTVGIVTLLTAMVTGAVLMLLFLLLIRMLRGFVKKKRSSRRNRLANTSNASNDHAIAIYDDIEDGGETRCVSGQRSNSTGPTFTMGMTNDVMSWDYFQGNYYCCPDEIIRDNGAIGKAVQEGTLNYITPVTELK